MDTKLEKFLIPPFDEGGIFGNLKLLLAESIKKKNIGKIKIKKIAILGGSTTSHLKDLLNIFLLNSNISADFYEGQFQLYYEEVIFNVGKLKEFDPDIMWIHSSWRNIKKFPDIKQSAQEINDLIESEFNFYKNMWEYAKNNLSCTVIQNNFDYPNYRILANKDSIDMRGKINFLSELNRKFNIYDLQNDWFNVFDINYLSFLNGSDKWQNERDWYKYKYSPSLDSSIDVAYGISRVILALEGLSLKCLVIDLDNTIWGGVIGDEGVEKIKLSSEDPIGDAYLDFQKYILELKNRGIILAVLSKNEDKIARLGFSHPNSILKIKDFSVFVANWNTKSSNIKEIIKLININETAAIFIDDNQMERDEVGQNSNVSVPNIGANVENFRKIIDRHNFFETVKLTIEDLKRPDSIRAFIESSKTVENYSNYNEYLKSLEMKTEIKKVDSVSKNRFVQLINKTNQFNLTLEKINSNNFSDIDRDNNTLALTASLTDKFSEYGIVSAIYGKITSDNEIDIKIWVMSCRVFKRTLEFAIFYKFAYFCKELEIKKINGFYKKSDRNGIVENLYKEIGFQEIKKTKDYSKWSLDTNVNLDFLKKKIKIYYE
jgi:FkbH-like protein